MTSARFHGQAISDAFVAARRASCALPHYPGLVPETLDDAYAIQDRSIAAWGEPVAGWKIGLIPPPLRAKFGAERLAGPIFASKVEHQRPGSTVEGAFIRGGFCAVEAEFVLRLSSDIPPSAQIDTDDALARFVAGMYGGVELAGSPFKGINDLGPCSVVSDFGNNTGLIVGPVISDWYNRPLESITVRTAIDGAIVGEGSAAKVPGGPLAALRFLVNHCRRHRIPLRAGTYLSSGAVTGIHEVAPPARASADFGAFGTIEIEVVEAKSRP